MALIRSFDKSLGFKETLFDLEVEDFLGADTNSPSESSVYSIL